MPTVQTHFSGARCTSAASKGAPKNKKIISLVICMGWRRFAPKDSASLALSLRARGNVYPRRAAQPRLQQRAKTFCAVGRSISQRYFNAVPQSGARHFQIRQMQSPPEVEIRAGALGVKHGALFKGTAGEHYHRTQQRTTSILALKRANRPVRWKLFHQSKFSARRGT
jgi:hypothetical protein